MPSSRTKTSLKETGEAVEVTEVATEEVIRTRIEEMATTEEAIRTKVEEDIDKTTIINRTSSRDHSSRSHLCQPNHHSNRSQK